MDNILKQRLMILEGSGQIQKETTLAIENFVRIVENEFNIEITEENGSMFVTHIAMAISRIIAGEEITPLDDLLLDELKSTPAYESIPSLIKQLEDELDIIIPESEYGYIGLHLGALG